MDLSVAKSKLDHFYAFKDDCVEHDDPTTTWTSCGAVLLASVLASSRSPRVLSKITGFPIAFAAAVLLVADAGGHYFSMSYADLLTAVLLHPEDLDRTEGAINELMVEFWAEMEPHWVHMLNTLRAHYLVGGKLQDWLHDEEEFGSLEWDEPLRRN